MTRHSARLMDEGQQYVYGYGYAGFGTGRYRDGGSIQEYRPYDPPVRRDPHELKPMISSLANTHFGSNTGRHSLGGGVPSLQSGLVVSPLQMPNFTSSPETPDKGYAYSGNIPSQGIANGYGPAGWVFQEKNLCRNQESRFSEVLQARSDPVTHLRQRYPDPISPFGSNTDRGPNLSPMEQMSVSFNGSLSFPYPGSPTTCANCRNNHHMEGLLGHHPEPRGVDAYTDFRVQRTRNYSLRPGDMNLLSNRQLPTQDTGRVVPPNDYLDVPILEQPKPRFDIRKSNAANAPDAPLIVSTKEDGADNGLSKTRKRKPRVLKPRKPRTLTIEGKAHAKACTHKLPEDIPMESPENTPWTEPPTPDHGPGHSDPVFYRSSQENDLSYENIDD